MTTVDPILDIRVYGAPAPQGSKRAVVHKQSGKAVVMESSKRVKPWREAVTAAALATGAGDRPPYDGELIVSMVFTFARPKSHYRTGRNAHLLRADAPKRPDKPPDLSKLLRSTEDALTHVVWTDDARIVEYGRAAKVWVGEDPDALDRPGAVITVWPARLDAVLSGQLGDTGRPPDLFDKPATRRSTPAGTAVSTSATSAASTATSRPMRMRRPRTPTMPALTAAWKALIEERRSGVPA